MQREQSKSLKLRPENGDCWATLDCVENKLDRLPEAGAALREAIRQSPLHADPHLTLSTVLNRQNHPAKATEERREAADLMRERMNLQRSKVSTHAANSPLASGKTNDAVADDREALSFVPNNVDAHEGLAKALDRLGKTMVAAAERQKAAGLRQSGPQ